MEFKKYRLSDIADIQTGPFGSQLHKEDYVETGTPIITVEHLGENKIIHSNLPKVNKKDWERLSKYALKKNDIVFSRVGSVDRCALVSDSEENWLFSGRCLRVRVKDLDIVDPKYLSYYFANNKFKRYIRSIAVGATMPSINTKILSEIQIEIPAIDSQREIAKLFHSLDSKKWVNESIVKNLEHVSSALFKQWFVDFEFPNKEGEFYKSSGGNMINSELGEIPGSFKTGNFKDVLELKYGKSLTKKNRIPGEYPVYGSGGITGTHEDYLITGPGLIIGRKGSIGKLYLEFNNFYPIDTVFYVESEIYEPTFLYLLFKQYDFTNSNNDSAVPGLNRDFVYNTKIIIPTSNVVREFQRIITPIYDQIENILLENKKIQSLRDFLLPKLISGETKISKELEV